MRALFAVFAVLLAAACTSLPPLPEHQPTLANVQLLRNPDIPALALGDFALAPGLPARMDRSVSVRAEILRAPGDGSFSNYLRQTLEAELTASGKLDAASGTAISGLLTRSQVETAGDQSTGTLGARFIVTRGGQTLYDREHVVTDAWPSNFIGAIAIPDAMTHYNALYPALVGDLLRNEDFRQSVRGASAAS